MRILREEALTIVLASLEEHLFKQPARAPPRRVQCFCQNEIEKIRRTYCLNPVEFFGLAINPKLFRN